jgi:hypothetical protein
MTEASQAALNILRDPSHFQWTILFGLGLVIYAYVGEMQKKNWDAILMGVLFSAGEFIWEMVNSLIFHYSGYAGLWTTPGNTSFLILSGINIEIFLLFSLAGLVLVKALQTFDDEPNKKIAGIGYRVFIPLCLGLFCVFVECMLNLAGALVWTWKYWNWPHIWSIVINYLTPFFLCAWAHYSLSRRAKAIWFYVLLLVDISLWVTFVNILGWI